VPSDLCGPRHGIVAGRSARETRKSGASCLRRGRATALRSDRHPNGAGPRTDHGDHRVVPRVWPRQVAAAVIGAVGAARQDRLGRRRARTRGDSRTPQGIGSDRRRGGDAPGAAGPGRRRAFRGGTARPSESWLHNPARQGCSCGWRCDSASAGTAESRLAGSAGAREYQCYTRGSHLRNRDDWEIIYIWTTLQARPRVCWRPSAAAWKVGVASVVPPSRALPSAGLVRTPAGRHWSASGEVRRLGPGER
jgi:hypothetical protein